MSSSSSSSSSKMITLKSSDGKAFEVEKTVVVQCQTLKHMIEDNCTDNAIPIANVTSKILAKVIEYCKKHVADDSDKAAYEIKLSDEDLKVWDADFIKDIKNDQSTLFELIHAADFLNIKSLLDLTCKTVADMMRGRTPEEIRRIFHIKNDYTPEEEEEVRKEIQWAFE